MYTSTHIHTKHTHTRPHIMHKQSHVHIYTHTYQTHTLSHVHNTHLHTYTKHTHTHILCINKQSHVHIYTHTYQTHTHTHTHTSLHIYKLALATSWACSSLFSQMLNYIHNLNFYPHKATIVWDLFKYSHKVALASPQSTQTHTCLYKLTSSWNTVWSRHWKKEFPFSQVWNLTCNENNTCT